MQVAPSVAELDPLQTYRCCRRVLRRPLRPAGTLVVFGAAVAAVAVYVGLAGALLVVHFPGIGRPPPLGSVLPQQRTGLVHRDPR